MIILLSFITLCMALYVTLPYSAEGLMLFLFGFGTGAFMIGFTMGKELNPAPLAASVIGLINSGDALFGAFSEPLAGKLLDVFWHGHKINHVISFSTHDYHLALSLLPAYLLLAMVMLLLIHKK